MSGIPRIVPAHAADFTCQCEFDCRQHTGLPSAVLAMEEHDRGVQRQETMTFKTTEV
jgi:hypothetical protein